MLTSIQKATFEITNRCNLHCQICRIWQEHPSRDLSCDDINRILAHTPQLSSVALTGGEPTLHPDIDRIYRNLCTLFLKKSIRSIDIATNAFSVSLIKFLLKHKKFLRPLSLSISLDGTATTHDTQRGTPGAFTQTLAHIKTAQKIGVPVLLKFTASATNHLDLPQVIKLAKGLNCPLTFKIAEKLTTYYHRKNGTPPLLEKKQRLELLEILGRDENARLFDPTVLLWHKKFLQTGRLGFIKNCRTPAHTLFITSHGIIYNCLYQKPIATLASWPEKINTRLFRHNINAGCSGQCPQCLAYHGSLQHFNISAPRKNDQATAVAA